MTRLPARSRTRMATAALVAVTTAGCGSGLNPQTYEQRTAADATNDAVGALAVRNLSVLPPAEGETLAAGADAPLTMTVVSEDTEPDQLVSINSDAARAVQVTRQGRPAQLVVPPLGVAEGYEVKLMGLTRKLRAGEYVNLELVFANNGRKLMPVPVAVTGRPGEKRKGYHPAETDSNGDPIVEEEAEEASEGSPSSEGEAGGGSGAEPAH